MIASAVALVRPMAEAKVDELLELHPSELDHYLTRALHTVAALMSDDEPLTIVGPAGIVAHVDPDGELAATIRAAVADADALEAQPDTSDGYTDGPTPEDLEDPDLEQLACSCPDVRGPWSAADTDPGCPLHGTAAAGVAR